ncbi:hypothetical protein VDGL01_02695 [Verticillium dahliae]
MPPLVFQSQLISPSGHNTHDSSSVNHSEPRQNTLVAASETEVDKLTTDPTSPQTIDPELPCHSDLLATSTPKTPNPTPICALSAPRQWACRNTHASPNALDNPRALLSSTCDLVLLRPYEANCPHPPIEEIDSIPNFGLLLTPTGSCRRPASLLPSLPLPSTLPSSTPTAGYPRSRARTPASVTSLPASERHLDIHAVASVPDGASSAPPSSIASTPSYVRASICGGGVTQLPRDLLFVHDYLSKTLWAPQGPIPPKRNEGKRYIAGRGYFLLDETPSQEPGAAAQDRAIPVEGSHSRAVISYTSRAPRHQPVAPTSV